MPVCQKNKSAIFLISIIMIAPISQIGIVNLEIKLNYRPWQSFWSVWTGNNLRNPVRGLNSLPAGVLWMWRMPWNFSPQPSRTPRSGSTLCPDSGRPMIRCLLDNFITFTFFLIPLPQSWKCNHVNERILYTYFSFAIFYNKFAKIFLYTACQMRKKN